MNSAVSDCRPRSNVDTKGPQKPQKSRAAGTNSNGLLQDVSIAVVEFLVAPTGWLILNDKYFRFSIGGGFMGSLAIARVLQ
jgi:hypothetical protein